MKILRKINALSVLMQLSRLAVGGLGVLQDRQEIKCDVPCKEKIAVTSLSILKSITSKSK
jgi:hypothetical protein